MKSRLNEEKKEGNCYESILSAAVTVGRSKRMGEKTSSLTT
jgi:hypothetical protein